MKRHRSITLLLTTAILLATAPLLLGQPVKDTCLVQKKLEAVRLPDMNLPRAGHSVFYVNGELTVVGGHTSGFVLTSTAEYFSEGEWHLMTTVYPHDNGMAVVLDGGKRVLIAGGHEKNLGIGQRYEAEMYDPLSHIFNGFGCLDHKRALAQGAELDSGRVLITGNHCNNDAFEIFDGKKFFHHVKDVAAWRYAPYVLPVAPDDAIAFGTVWRNGYVPCDTVDRLKGEPFCVPLLKEWMPLNLDQNNHAHVAFIGNKTSGDYSYLIAARHLNGEMGFIHIHDTVFTLLPTTRPVPTRTKWGSILYIAPANVDTLARRAYLLGSDTTGRACIVAVEYDKRPAPLTLYYTDPLPDFGNTMPVLTPEGDLIVTGGIFNDNFAPFSSVWLLPVGERKAVATTEKALPETASNKAWLWLLGGLLLVASVVLVIRRFASLTTSNAEHLRAQRSNPENKASDLDGFVVPPRNDEKDNEETQLQPDPVPNELMTRIIQLMETERPYMNPNLKLTDVAEVLGVHRNVVSACLSAQGSTFSQLVNDYRLQRAKELLLSESGMKMATIGLESGFANERTFFRVFKDATGMTPKEWAAQPTAS